MQRPEAHDTIVIGAGQAGLATGHALAARGVPFTILDADARVGDAWRRRWSSLRLHSPAGVSGLPGLPFPADPASFPGKDAVADYLEAYAAHFRLPVEHGVRVTRLARAADGYTIEAGARRFHARHVVVATGSFARPWLPPFAGELDPAIAQVHAGAYRDPDALPAGDVLVVGAGNSGAEIAMELATRGRRVILSGRHPGRIPAATLVRLFGRRVYWWVLSRVLSVRTPIGRRARPKMLSRGAPLITIRRQDVLAAGAIAAPRTIGARDGRPLLDDGRALDVQVVVWATGFRPAFDWIDLPILDDRGLPRHDGGVVADAPGLCFVGLFFQTALTSSLLGGVGADAARIAERIARARARDQVSVGGGVPSGAGVSGAGASVSSR